MTHASLFSGIGGPEVAAAMLGWRNVFHCEINPFGRRVLEYWFPESVSYEDITKTDFTEWRGKIDVLTAGFPCQPFSLAGKRGGAGDERYLWPEAFRAVDEIRPAWFISENVAGIASMVEGGALADLGCEASLLDEGDGVHRYRLEQTFTIERICRDLEAIGYEVQPMLIPAAACGAPHRRDRIFFLAHFTENSISDGRLRKPCDGEEKSEKRGQRMPCAGDSERICNQAGTDVAHAGNARSESVRQERQDTVRGLTTAAYSNGADRKRGDLEAAKRRSRPDVGTGPFGSGMLPENRWKDFPTVSPVHSGNDGLPFNVADLTIPLSTWRKEAIKACGNAIVPQVMYRIFQAIEQVTNNKK